MDPPDCVALRIAMHGGRTTFVLDGRNDLVLRFSAIKITSVCVVDFGVVDTPDDGVP